MYQIYFLSVLFNGLAGIVLCSDYISEKFAGFAGIGDLLNGVKTKFTIGIITFIVGALKLFFPVRYIFGDFVPALGGLFLGFVLLMDFLKQRSVINTDMLLRIDSLITSNKTLIGVVGLIIAAVHFFFAGAFMF